MSNGWRRVLHTAFFGLAGPALALIATDLLFLEAELSILLLGLDPEGAGYRKAQRSLVWEVVTIAYVFGGIPGLITGAVTAHAACRWTRWRLYATAALTGLVTAVVWATGFIFITALRGHFDITPLDLLIMAFVSMCGCLCALACTWLARWLRPQLSRDNPAP